MRLPWIIKETAGSVLLLGVIIYAPVVVSEYTAPKGMPFHSNANHRNWVSVFPSNPETRQAIMHTVAGQLEAIRDGSFEIAFGFASSGIQEEQSVESFEKMVRDHYQPMLNYEAIEISNAFDDGKQGVIRIRLSQNRIPTGVYSYIMALEEDQWKIGGVISDGPINGSGSPSNPSR